MKVGQLTAQMNESQNTMLKVYDIIQTLLSLTDKGDCVDGETMQFIIERVGMEDQMLRQLVMSATMDDVFCLVEEKNML